MTVFDLPVSRHVVTLRLTGPAHFHFYHGGAVMGLLCAALCSHPLPERLIPFACESGVVGFEPGEAYQIAFTILGADAGLSDEVVAGLERVGAERPEGRPPALGGNFVVERHEVLPLA